MTNVPVVPPANSVTDFLAGLSHALVPEAVKALSRLIGAAADYPTAIIKRETAKVDAQAKSYQLVETAIAKVAAKDAAGDDQIVARAMETLVRKEYRKQANREAVAIETARVLTHEASEIKAEEAASVDAIQDDWFHVFERYAEEASSERLRQLWGRVLAGEIGKPGSYSAKTLRTLAEMSQADAMQFAEFARMCFVDCIPINLINSLNGDLTPIIDLEAAGAIVGKEGTLLRRLNFSDRLLAVRAGNYVLVIGSDAGAQVQIPAYLLTPVGKELMTVLQPEYTPDDLRRFAESLRPLGVKSAEIKNFVSEISGKIRSTSLEILWRDETIVDNIITTPGLGNQPIFKPET